MASKAITVWAPVEGELQNQIELVGSTIGILGVIFFISGLFYRKEAVMH
jgi:hypothetical protein